MDIDYKTAKPVIAPNAYIAPNATVLGNVTLGEECTILFGAVLRGDVGEGIKLGDCTNVQDNAVIHSQTTLGSHVTVGHGAIVHGCTVGDGSLIGMGAILLDRARIGKNCLIGAGALVTGTADIPDGMLVLGSPARAIRPLSDEEIEKMHGDIDHYVIAGRQMAEAGLLLTGRAN